jgi:hypothetical protein
VWNKILVDDKGAGVKKVYPFIVNDLTALDVVKEIDPSLLELNLLAPEFYI